MEGKMWPLFYPYYKNYVDIMIIIIMLAVEVKLATTSALLFYFENFPSNDMESAT